MCSRFPQRSPSAPTLSSLPTPHCQIGRYTSSQDQPKGGMTNNPFISSGLSPTKNILSSPSYRRKFPLHGGWAAETGGCVRWGEVYGGEERTGSFRGAEGRSCLSSHPESILVEWERILPKGPLGSGRRGSDSQSCS